MKGDWLKLAVVGVLLVIAVGVAQMFPSLKLIILGRASEDNLPKKIKLTNLSPNSLTLSWVTNRPVLGAVVYTADQISQIAYQEQLSTVHHVTVEHLLPDKNYSFTLISGEGSYNFGDSPL